jgi:hypothetical protein
MLACLRLLHTHGTTVNTAVLRVKIVFNPGYVFKGPIKNEPNPDAEISFPVALYGIFGFRTELQIGSAIRSSTFFV